ncbi:AbrB/MazE/SpoVT family DNA-binding domain-containing protein [Alicyclobacillus curvatus]|nr:AbrB/MazE/SpoVT family DNA-binding domain-containing protein [Alicyclobacillus curvatus]
MARMTRQVDNVGRIVIPIEIRETFHIVTNDHLEIFVDEDQIILKKYEPGCVMCGEVAEDYIQFHGKRVCENCAKAATEVMG